MFDSPQRGREPDAPQAALLEDTQIPLPVRLIFVGSERLQALVQDRRPQRPDFIKRPLSDGVDHIREDHRPYPIGRAENGFHAPAVRNSGDRCSRISFAKCVRYRISGDGLHFVQVSDARGPVRDADVRSVPARVALALVVPAPLCHSCCSVARLGWKKYSSFARTGP